jgi:ABC-type transporter MlaC component
MSFAARMSPHRLAAVAAALAAMIAAAAAPARAGDPVEDARGVIQAMWSAVAPILADKRMSREARESRFAAVYRAHFDNRAIAAAVAGAPWQKATPQQRERFVAVFERYVVKVYAGQFANYKGEQLAIVASERDGDGAVVTTRVVDDRAALAAAPQRRRAQGARRAGREHQHDAQSAARVRRRRAAARRHPRGAHARARREDRAARDPELTPRSAGRPRVMFHARAGRCRLCAFW